MTKNHMDVALDEIDERVITLGTEKSDKNEIKDVVINGETGQLSATYLDGTVVTIDMSKTDMSFYQNIEKNREKTPLKKKYNKIKWENYPKGMTPV